MHTKLAAILLLLIIVLFTGFKTSETLLCSNADLPTPEASKISGSKLLWTSETILKLNANERDVRFSPFRNNIGQTIKFRAISSILKSETSAVIHVTIDNGEREREFDINCNVFPDSLILQTSIQAFYYNYSKTFTAKIPLK